MVWWAPTCHCSRESTILSAVLAVQEMRQMGLNLLGSLGLGMGWMLASFHMGSRQPANQEALSMASRVAFPADPACASIKYIKTSAPAAMLHPFFLVWISS